MKAAKGLFLLTSKPVLYVCNVDEGSAATGNHYVEEVHEAVAPEGAEAFAFRGTLHESGDVNDFHRCRHDAPRMHQFGQFGKTFVGHRDDTHVGLDGAEREIGRLRFGVAQTIEEGGLAHVGESNYTTL
jgi:hypothetical protein